MEITTRHWFTTGSELIAFWTVTKSPSLEFLFTFMVKQGVNMFVAFWKRECLKEPMCLTQIRYSFSLTTTPLDTFVCCKELVLSNNRINNNSFATILLKLCLWWLIVIDAFKWSSKVSSFGWKPETKFGKLGIWVVGMEGLKTKRREGQGNLATCGCIWIGLFHSHPLDPLWLTVKWCFFLSVLDFYILKAMLKTLDQHMRLIKLT